MRSLTAQELEEVSGGGILSEAIKRISKSLGKYVPKRKGTLASRVAELARRLQSKFKFKR